MESDAGGDRSEEQDPHGRMTGDEALGGSSRRFTCLLATRSQGGTAPIFLGACLALVCAHP